MKSVLIDEREKLRTFVLVLATGDEPVETLTAFAAEQGLGGSHFTAIGAFSQAIIAYFDWPSRQYRQIRVDEQVEVVSLIGDITLEKGKPKVHAHVVLGKADGTAHGGHLMQAIVRPTLEVVTTELPQHLVRRFDPDSGLALIDLSKHT
jgi:predicted DNA-binding protein with PD1-like motif